VPGFLVGPGQTSTVPPRARPRCLRMPEDLSRSPMGPASESNGGMRAASWGAESPEDRFPLRGFAAPLSWRRRREILV
jgi:hypothetical protein